MDQYSTNFQMATVIKLTPLLIPLADAVEERWGRQA